MVKVKTHDTQNLGVSLWKWTVPRQEFCCVQLRLARLIYARSARQSRNVDPFTVHDTLSQQKRTNFSDRKMDPGHQETFYWQFWIKYRELTCNTQTTGLENLQTLICTAATIQQTPTGLLLRTYVLKHSSQYVMLIIIRIMTYMY